MSANNDLRRELLGYSKPSYSDLGMVSPFGSDFIKPSDLSSSKEVSKCSFHPYGDPDREDFDD